MEPDSDIREWLKHVPDLNSAFRTLDVNGDGFVSPEELRAAVEGDCCALEIAEHRLRLPPTPAGVAPLPCSVLIAHVPCTLSRSPCSRPVVLPPNPCLLPCTLLVPCSSVIPACSLISRGTYGRRGGELGGQGGCGCATLAHRAHVCVCFAARRAARDPARRRTPANGEWSTGAVPSMDSRFVVFSS